MDFTKKDQEFIKLSFDDKKQVVSEMLKLMEQVPLAQDLAKTIDSGDVTEPTLDYIYNTLSRVIKKLEKEDFDKNANQTDNLQNLKKKLK